MEVRAFSPAVHFSSLPARLAKVSHRRSCLSLGPRLRRGYQTKEAMSGAPVKEEVAAEPAPAPAPAAEPGEAAAPPAAAAPVTAVTPISAAPQQPPAAPMPAMGISGAQMPAALPAQVRPPAPPVPRRVPSIFVRLGQLQTHHVGQLGHPLRLRELRLRKEPVVQFSLLAQRLEVKRQLTRHLGP